ncbi:MAG: AfsR/SARP family transcriptional regulator [Gaiellaceae bacterium]
MYEFRLLGPLEALIDGNPVNLAATKPRALLALLLLHRNRVVPTETLIDELWGDEPPARATKTLQVYVSQLRKELGPERLLTRAPGYELRVAEDELDVDRFEKLTAEARERLAVGDAAGAVEGMRRALDLWRGPALLEFRVEPFAERAAARLEDLRLAAVEDWLLAALETGEAAGIVPELEELVASHPLRERPRELLMLALYRAGRQADALELFRRTRELFVSQLGIEPGASLRELEQAMLRQDTALLGEVRARRATSMSPVDARPRRRRAPWAVVAVAALAAAAIVAALLVHDGGTSSPPTTAGADPQVRSFVYKLENFLAQSHDGRAQVIRPIAGAFDCSLSPDVAAAQLDKVQRNRQSLLEQVAALHVPDSEATLHASDLFQKATHASIAADWIYRDWLRSRPACPQGGRLPAAARAADARATALKQRFLVVFDPLAKRFGRRTWKANEF